MSSKLFFIHSLTHTKEIHSNKQINKQAIRSLCVVSLCSTSSVLYCGDYVQNETKSYFIHQNPESGLIKRAENAKARNTIPPMIVTVDITKGNISK